MRKTSHLAAIAILALAMPLGALESVEDLNPLYKALPAKRFAVVEGWERVRTAELPLSRTTGMFYGESTDGRWQGVVVHLVSEGYGGPIGLLVGFDTAGTILRVLILQHSETECHVPGLSNGALLARFVGIELMQKIRLLIGMKGETQADVEAISGGTVSSRAVTEAIVEARLAFHQVRSNGLLRTL